jgi:hypothetical protein
VVDPCGRGNELSGTIKWREFFHWLGDC